jgi:hypothetical protein
MKWFKKSSQSVTDNDASSPRSKLCFKWFKRATAEEFVPSELQNEVNIVPKTEITTSPQALSNITLALSAVASSSSSSGESSRKYRDVVSKTENCENKYCCDVKSHSHLVNADKCDESIIDFADNKSITIDSVRLIENDEKMTVLGGRSGKFNEDFENYYTSKDSHAPDSILINLSLLMNDEKSVGQQTALKRKLANYKLLSNIEGHLDTAKYNIMNCIIFNAGYQEVYETFGSGCRPNWKVEDSNDDYINTSMSDDTKAIKEFYRLSELEDILLHYQDIAIGASYRVERTKDGFIGFISWLMLKGKEIKEKHKVKEEQCSWFERIVKVFSKCDKKDGKSSSFFKNIFLGEKEKKKFFKLSEAHLLLFLTT